MLHPALQDPSAQPAPFGATEAMQIFAALSQPGRLAVFIDIVGAGPDGCDGALLGTSRPLPKSALTLHLRSLEAAGLITVRGRSRARGGPIFVARIEQCRRLGGWFVAACGQAWRATAVGGDDPSSTCHGSVARPD